MGSRLSLQYLTHMGVRETQKVHSLVEEWPQDYMPLSTQQGTEVRGSLLHMAPTLSGDITQAAPGTLNRWFSICQHTFLLQVACDHTQDSPDARYFPVEPTKGEAQRVGSRETRYVSGSFT